MRRIWYTEDMYTGFKKKFLTSAAIILGSVVLAWIMLYFLAGNVASAVAKIVTARSLINQQTGSLAVFSSLKQQATQAEPYQTAMDALLPSQDGLIGFQQWFANIGSQQNVSAQATFQGGVTAPTDTAPGQTKFSFASNGSLNNLAAFLTAIKQTPGFFLRITSFHVSQQGDVYELDGQGNVFFR
jgi:hypothetical protein